jgi:adenine-specific DNA-methyltransferase
MTPTLAGSSARALGAYYTPPVAAQVLVEWALRDRADRILEPSMGDGAFLQAVAAESARRGVTPEVFGVELAADTFETTVASGAVARANAIRDDFLAVAPFPVDAVVGNPPYVRLRHLPPEQDRRAQAVAQQVLGQAMDPAGSVWMPFVLHATEFLRPGGRLALVLPYDLTYVRYARPLWSFLGRHFAELRVVRVHERMFDIMQETVLLLAGGYGGTTSEIDFDAYETVARLAGGRPTSQSRIPIADVVRGDRAFLEALLSDDARALLRGRLGDLTAPASDLVTFNIGYVCGDKRFFHPDAATIARHSLPEASLRPALTSSRQFRGVGLRTSGAPAESFSRLFLPPTDPEALTPGERRYVALGRKAGVADRYKCRMREPWYVTPYVKVPDVFLPVFTERPALLVNDARLVASNSLLCGYVKSAISPDALAAAWFTSLTVLQLELQIHALGGGVMVLVPREAGAVRLPKGVRATKKHLRLLDDLLTHDKVEQAFTAGDEPVLRDQVGLTATEVALVEEAADTLTHWRNAASSS